MIPEKTPPCEFLFAHFALERLLAGMYATVIRKSALGRETIPAFPANVGFPRWNALFYVS